MSLEETILKLKNNEILTEKEIQNLVLDFNHVEEIGGDQHRWQQEVSTIIEVDNKFFRIDWMRGLTEYQENDYLEQPYEVIPKEKTITIKKWEKVNKE